MNRATAHSHWLHSNNTTQWWWHLLASGSSINTNDVQTSGSNHGTSHCARLENSGFRLSTLANLSIRTPFTLDLNDAWNSLPYYLKLSGCLKKIKHFFLHWAEFALSALRLYLIANCLMVIESRSLYFAFNKFDDGFGLQRCFYC